MPGKGEGKPVADPAFCKKIDHQIRHLGGAFEHYLVPRGWELELTNLHKFKLPGGCPGGVRASNRSTNEITGFKEAEALQNLKYYFTQCIFHRVKLTPKSLLFVTTTG